MATTQSFNGVVDISVSVSPASAPRAGFNQMLIIGPSTIISKTDRIKGYTSVADMATDGFTTSHPEYLAAQKYFAQSPTPKKIWIGCVDLTVPETFAEAAAACRTANGDWYTFMVVGTVADTDHKDLALWTESATPSTVYAWNSNAAEIKAGTAGNLAEFFKQSMYKRTIGQYTSDAYGIAAIMGYAMGQFSGLANSAYTLKFKSEVSVLTEDLDTTSIGLIKGNNCNMYLSYGNFYNWFTEGVMANGWYFDRLINLDSLVNNIQLSVADLLNQNAKIAQTDSGVSQIINAINSACSQSASIGFLAPGVWNGSAILNLDVGDYMPTGYVVQASPVASQSKADRDARKSPPIYVSLCEAGAIHSTTIGVYLP